MRHQGSAHLRAGAKKQRKCACGKTTLANALLTTWPTISLVPGCAECAFTITGFPAASADAVSPPATENASGKLLDPNTATGPSGRSTERISALGSGVRCGSAGSMRAFTHEPSPPPAQKDEADSPCAPARL